MKLKLFANRLLLRIWAGKIFLVLQITSFLLLLSINQLFAVDFNSQNAGINLNKADKPVKEVLTAQQPGKKISGKVTDSSGGVLPGVSVVVKGTTTGVITDNNGNYSLNVPARGEALVFSFVGMSTQEIKIGSQTVIDLVLTEETIGLEEVVAIGYGTQKKVNLTGSIASVKTEQLANIPAANLSNALAGRAPGVTVIGTSGLAGASSNIRIRGSFADPLYVINGVIKAKNDFDALDASEVQSINFLKDAASASIYGSKAGNGVVLVTTKAGTVQKPVFEYKGSYSSSTPTRPLQNYSATQELEYLNQMNVTAGQPKPYGQEVFDYFKNRSYSINDYIWQSPSVQQHNLSVNGGTEALTYYLALGYHTEEGSYKNLNYDRYNFRSDVTAKITKRFKVNFNISGNQRNYHRWYWPYDGAEDFNVSDFYRATFNWTRLYPFYVDDKGDPTTDTKAYPVVPGAWHPVELMLNSPGYRDIRYRTLDGIIRFDLDLADILPGLSTSLMAHYNGYDKFTKAFIIHNKAYIFQSASTTNKFIPGPINPTKINLHNLSSTYQGIQESGDFYNSYQLNWYLRYDKTFGKHDISALGVYEQSSDYGRYMSGNAMDILTPQIDQIYNASADATKRYFNGSEGQTARASWIGRVHYGFSSKYMAEFSFRYDGNYKFAPKKQWGFFPSVSAGWRISQENFMKNISLLSNLKLRGSYGTSGNDDVNAFMWSQTYGKSTGYILGTSLYDGLSPNAMPNPDVTWSTSKMTDIGIDYGLFDNHLNGEIDIFKRTQSDILGSRLGSTPSTLGATLPAVNYAQRSWKGYEFSINWDDKIGEVKYSVYANMGYSIDQWDVIDEAKALTDGTYKDNWRSQVGKPANRIGGYIAEKMIRTQAELDAIPSTFTQFGRKPMLGTLLFKDIRGQNYAEGADGKIDSNDWTYLSDNGVPRINYGIGFKVEWRGISLQTHFQGVGAYDRMVRTMNGDGVFQVDRPYFQLWSNNYWTTETPNAKYPRIAGGWMQEEFGGGGSTFWMRKGAYMRLKNLDIAYTLPKSLYSKVGLSRIQVFMNATNLFVISGMKEHDPEQNTLDSYPLMKTITGGLNINF
jgi:TonB-linked SusC/RagA family outer membrane protein